MNKKSCLLLSIFCLLLFTLVFIFSCNKMNTPIEPTPETTTTISPLKDTIIVAGSHNNGANDDWWIKKLTSDAVEDTTNWNKMIDGGNGDIANTMVLDGSNNLYVAGAKDIGVGDTNWWVKKFDSAGNEITTGWNKIIDQVDDEEAMSIAIDTDNSVYIVGYKDTGVNWDWWMKKYYANGSEDANLNKTINGSANGNDVANCVLLDTNRNVYMLGAVDNGTDTDWWIKKFDSAGNEITTGWNKTIPSSTSGNDQILSGIIDSSNNLYAVGTKSMKDDNSDTDWWIKKFDANGNEIATGWDKTYEGGTNGLDEPKSITIDKQGYIYIVGTMDKGSGNTDWWIKKFDANGNEITTNWNKVYDGGSSGNDVPMSVKIDSSNNVYVAGYKRSGGGSYWMIKKFDSNGSELWNQIFGDDQGQANAMVIYP